MKSVVGQIGGKPTRICYDNDYFADDPDVQAHIAEQEARWAKEREEDENGEWSRPVVLQRPAPVVFLSPPDFLSLDD